MNSMKLQLILIIYIRRHVDIDSNSDPKSYLIFNWRHKNHLHDAASMHFIKLGMKGKSHIESS